MKALQFTAAVFAAFLSSCAGVPVSIGLKLGDAAGRTAGFTLGFTRPAKEPPLPVNPSAAPPGKNPVLPLP